MADHFDLYLILFAPLSLIFKTYTLLIVQIAFVLVGGWGVFKLFELSPRTKKLSIFATLFFYIFFGVLAGLAYDYHSNVVAACIVPWFFYYIKKDQLKSAALILLTIIIAKENIALWTAFICLGLAIEKRFANATFYFSLRFAQSFTFCLSLRGSCLG